MCVLVCMHVRVHVCAFARIRAHMHACVCVYVRMRTHVRVDVCVLHY